MAENIIAVGIDLAKNAFAVHGSRRSCDSVKASPLQPGISEMRQGRSTQNGIEPWVASDKVV
jgi:hypothetical protein